MSMQPPLGNEPTTPLVEGTISPYPPSSAPPGQGSPPAPAAAAPADRDGGLALAGLILALLSMACLIGGIGLVLFRHAPGLAALLLFWGMPLGVMGVVLSAIGRGSVRWHGSAIAGLVLSTLAVGLTALFLLAGLSIAGRRLPTRPHPGAPRGADAGQRAIVRLYVPPR